MERFELGPTAELPAAKHVFGPPIERDGVTLVPVAIVRGGGGGGGGEAPAGDGERGMGSGVGFGLVARPLGAFAIRQGRARWVPAIDVNRVILGAQLVVCAGLLLLRSLVSERRGHGRLRLLRG